MTTALAKRRSLDQLPAEEQSVVKELTQVLRRHQNQPPARVVSWLWQAFVALRGGQNSREDKLARAQARGLLAREQLAEAEGGSLSSEEVARMLRISKTAVLKRLGVGHLLAWREERLQAARFPRWQFDEHGQVLAGLPEVLAILNGDERLDPWAKILFFLQTKPSLGDKRPLDLLRQAKVKEACLAAQAYVE